MSGPIRQSNLFAAEDFLKVYRSFKDVDFTAYDFDTIRSALVEYIQRHYPEDFNDYIESSEFVAIIELLSYLGTSLALRTDLNSRENFLDTADRRESIIRLARMLSYNPSRNLPAKGLFKITGVQTNAPITDSLGRDLSQTTVFWNDANNPDSYEQFVTILNSAFNSTNQFGSPSKNGIISDIPTQLYQINSVLPRDPVSSLSISIPAGTLPWNIVNPDFNDGETFYERHPDPDEAMHIIYRNDSLGLGSKDTGFFLFLKQGAMINANYQLDYPVKNRVLNVDGQNINQEDVYFQEIDSSGTVISEWTQVPALVGNNVIFNSLELEIRDIFNVITDTDDQIKLKFADGNFGSIPRGLYRLWYRQSVNQYFSLSPDDVSGLSARFPYIGKNGEQYILTVYYELEETIKNSTPSETNDTIKLNAPAVFYTQNRMVNAEDYAVYPLTRGNEVVKVKAINRTHAGHSRFIALNDPTGITQNVKVFAEDGAIYKEYEPERTRIDIDTSTNYENVLDEEIFLFMTNERMRNYFYDVYYRQYSDSYSDTLDLDALNYRWATLPQSKRGSTGFFLDGNDDWYEFNWVYDSATTTWVAIDPVSGTTYLASESLSGVTNIPLTIKDLDYTVEAGILITENDFYIRNKNIVIYNNYVPADGATITVKYREPVEIGSAINGLIQKGSVLYFYDPDVPEDTAVVSLKGITNSGIPVTTTTYDAPIELSAQINDQWQLSSIMPPFRVELSDSERADILAEMQLNNDFALAYDIDTSASVPRLGAWRVIKSSDIDIGDITEDNFLLDTSGSVTDSSWLLYFNFVPNEQSSSNEYYEIISRGTRYIFESLNEVRFFYDEDQPAIDITTGKEKVDEIVILDKNLKPAVETTETWYLWGDGFFRNAPVSDSSYTYEYPSSTGIPMPIIDREEYMSITTTNSYVNISVADINERGVLDTSSFDNWFAGDEIEITYNSAAGTLDDHIGWNAYRSYDLEDGYLDQTKLEIVPFDTDNDGVPDDPLSFDLFVQPNDTIYFEQYIDMDGYEYYRPWKTGYNEIETTPTITMMGGWELSPYEEYNGRVIQSTGLFIFQNKSDILTFVQQIEDIENYVTSTEILSEVSEAVLRGRQQDYAKLLEDKIIYNKDTGIFYTIPFIEIPNPPAVPEITHNWSKFVINYEHYTKNGRTVTLDEFATDYLPMWFKWKHYAQLDNRIDPSISNIIDMYILTTSYYREVQVWKEENRPISDFPDPPRTDELTVQFGGLNEYKMLSDQIIYQSAAFKVIFGEEADPEYRVIFKVIKLPSTFLSDSEIKSRVIRAVNTYFDINNWDFGESFYYTELAAYIHQELASIIASVIIVPTKAESQFGDLFQIKAEPNELFLSTATPLDVEIVTTLTDTNMRLN
jgi:hypothetical protein